MYCVHTMSRLCSERSLLSIRQLSTIFSFPRHVSVLDISVGSKHDNPRTTGYLRGLLSMTFRIMFTRNFRHSYLNSRVHLALALQHFKIFSAARPTSTFSSSV
ncbi:unnamed protein product [Ixodes hexagonus]